MMEKYMKSSLIAILAILSSSSAYAWGPSHSTPPTTQSAQYVLPGPPTVLASPGVHQSGNDCAPDNADRSTLASFKAQSSEASARAAGLSSGGT